ncbi:hypothetical protein HK101_008389 [Irineochytrium annulatum]|nr:hypothetical protein HK101_008389 [Irineochytrium annulatum]
MRVGHHYRDALIEAGYKGFVADESTILAAFFKSFRNNNAASPCFGHGSAGGDRVWWDRVIGDTYGGLPEMHLSDGMRNDVSRLLFQRFSTATPFRLYDESRRVLQALRDQGRVVGVITDSDSRTAGVLKSLLGDSGPRVDFVVTSYEIGVGKPDRRIFDRALEMANEVSRGGHIKACHAVHVGDSMMRDYVGAKSAGWDARLLVRDGEPPEGVESILTLEGMLDIKN